MQNIEEIVNVYLQMETNYALLLTGPWGSGKTHMIKYNVFDKIKKTPVMSDNRKKYHPIIVSLFGLSSIEDIQLEIILSLYPLLKNKYIQLGTSLGKGLFKGLLKLKNFDQFNDLFDQTNVNKKIFIDFNEIFLCFDDLERISPTLQLEEFVGYVNSLVEDNNVKIIILANEQKFEHEKYSELKEKVIGNVIQMIPDFKVVVANIIQTRFSSFRKYQTFLQSHLNLIYVHFGMHSQNFRILIFSLSYFQQVFSNLELTVPHSTALKDKAPEIFRDTLIFSFAISLEYKEGRVSFKNRNELDRRKKLPVNQLILEQFYKKQNNERKNEEKKYYEQFQDKYYEGRDHRFYESIFDFITGGGELKTDRFLAELIELYPSRNENTTPHNQVFQFLRYMDVFQLKDNDYVNLTRQLLSYSDQGLYELPAYPVIFHFVARFNNPLNLNLDNLERRIISGMKRSRSRQTYTPNLDMQFDLSSNDINIKHIRAIADECILLNKDILIKTEKKVADTLQDAFFRDIADFCKIVAPRDSDYCFKPIFAHFNPQRVYNYLIHLDPGAQVLVCQLLEDRVRYGLVNEIKAERPFFSILARKIRHRANRLKGKNVSGEIFNRMAAIMENYLVRLPSD